MTDTEKKRRREPKLAAIIQRMRETPSGRLLVRYGFEPYDTESAARRVATRAALDIQQLVSALDLTFATIGITCRLLRVEGHEDHASSLEKFVEEAQEVTAAFKAPYPTAAVPGEDALIAAAKRWMIDCAFYEEDEIAILMEGAPAANVRYFVEKTYSGGWAKFVEDHR